MDAPDAVTLEPPERLLWVVRFPGRPELLQQSLEIGLGFTKRHLAEPALPPAEGVEDQERLVWGALISLFPDAQLIETSEDGFAIHGLASCPQSET